MVGVTWVGLSHPNNRVKLAACGTLAHGNERRRSHAAAYAGRWAALLRFLCNDVREFLTGGTHCQE
jgi:hypothetical protein